MSTVPTRHLFLKLDFPVDIDFQKQIFHAISPKIRQWNYAYAVVIGIKFAFLK